MNPPTDDETEERTHRDGPTSSSHSRRSYGGIALVLLALIGATVFGASTVVGADATNNALQSGDVGASLGFATTTDPAARCTVSDTSVQVGESVTIDASESENADDYQYDKYGNEAFGEYTTQRSRVVEYSEPGTYNPQVKVWSYSDGETSDVAACGTITVTEATPTPTPTPTATPTPTPSAVAKCTLSETSVQIGESVTIDASESENADNYQYDRYGDGSFGEYTAQSSGSISYSEPGTYEPRVKVWSYSGGEDSDVTACGTITVTEATPTSTPTPTPAVDAKCTLSETSVQVDESVTIDASESANVDNYQYDRYGDGSFGGFVSQNSRVVAYSEPGTYEPRVKVWSYSDGEDTDVTVCGTVTVTESTPTATANPTSTVTPTPTPTAAPPPTDSEASVSSTGTTTPVPTAAATETSASTTGTATGGEVWFRVSPDDPSATDTVRLVAQPAVAQDAVEAHGWDIGDDGTVDRRGRVLELPASTGGETTVTLTIERTNGSTASVTREVPISPDFAGETVTPEQPAAGTGGNVPVAAFLALLLVLIAAVVAWSRMDR